MKVFIKFSENNEDLNLCKPGLDDWNVFKVIISQKEGEMAIARLLMPANKIDGSRFGQWALISMQDDDNAFYPLFRGKCLNFPRSMDDNIVEVELLATSENADEQLKRLVETLKIQPFWDPLFIEEEHPADVLEARPDLFYWNRCTGSVTISNIFKGSKTIDISEVVFKDSLKMLVGQSPLTTVDVTVSAKWTQRAEGRVNIFPKIAKAFPEGAINTLTPNQFMANWPRTGDKLGPSNTLKRSGYQIIDSKVLPFKPPSTGILNIYPTVTPQMTLGYKGDAKTMRLPRYWLKGRLVVHFTYMQKRKEVAHIQVHQKSQVCGAVQRKKSIHINFYSKLMMIIIYSCLMWGQPVFL